MICQCLKQYTTEILTAKHKKHFVAFTDDKLNLLFFMLFVITPPLQTIEYTAILVYKKQNPRKKSN